MQKRLAMAIDDSMPRFNQTLVEGFHQKEFENGLYYYNQCLTMILKNIESRGVYFKGAVKVPPKEFIEYLRKTSNKIFDIHKETVYPIKLLFEYKDKSGTMIKMGPTYTMLPFTDRFGDVWLRGVHYSLQFVLAERGLPVTKENTLFIKVLGFKFKIGVEYFKYDQVFTDTGLQTSKTSDINLASNRFYSPTKVRKITDSKTPIPLLAWYIFATKGFSWVMSEYGECDYRIGSVDALIGECKESDRWEIMSRSTSSNQKYFGSYISHDLAIAVRNKSPKRKTLSTMGLQYTAALLFVMDCMSSYFDVDRIDDSDYWKLIIGRCSVKPGDTDEYIIRLMNEHFESIEEYLDDDSIKRFANQSIVVNDVYDLFNYIIANRGEIVQTTDRSSCFFKELASLEFTLDKLITAANNFKHEIKNNSELSQKKVARFLSSNFHLKEIDNARTTNLIQEATPTDNPYVDYGLGCMPQHKVYTSSTRGRKKGEFDTSDSAGFLHASLPFVHSHLRVSAPAPDGRGFLSPCIFLINGRVTALNPLYKELYDKTDHRLKNREYKKE